MARRRTTAKQEAPPGSQRASGGEREVPSATVNSKASPGTADTQQAKRIKNYANDRESIAYEQASRLYNPIQQAYNNQENLADQIEEYWNIYNAIPDENQQYSGNSQCYVPAVRDAINARAKRALKQLFPATHKHVEAISADGDIPYTQLSLIEHYIHKTNLKSTIRSMLIAGDVTGQWNLHIDWLKTNRKVRGIIQKSPIVEVIDGEDVRDLGIPLPGLEAQEAIDEQEVTEEGPEITEFATSDLAVIPPTASSIDKAEAVSLRLRMSEEAVQMMVDEGVFELPEGTANASAWFKGHKESVQSRQKTVPPQKMTADAGVKVHGTWAYALIYYVQAKIQFEEGQAPEEACIYFSGPNQIIGLIRSPYWGGKRDIISAPVDKLHGSFFGRSKVEPVKYLQWNLTDYWNMGQDSAMYSLMPIWAANPEKNPNWQSMVMGLAAVWPIAPQDIQPITQPQLYKDSMAICSGIKMQIWESLEVNEMMMGRTPQGRKNNALIGAMQQEQNTVISDHAERVEEVILNPLIERIFEYDQQFRTDALTVKARGEIGVKASMIDVEPQQWGNRYFFRWDGTAFIIGQNRLQQQIAWMNVLKGVPPAMLDGRRLSVLPILEAGTENIFGPDIAPKILIDERNMFTIDAAIENEMIWNQFVTPVHPGDNDVEHLREHMQVANQTGDPAGLFKQHMQAHMMQLQQKRQQEAAQMQMMMKGAPGSPGGAGPGVAGTPRPGAMPGQPRFQGPPGMVQADAMVDPLAAGRG